MVEEGYYIFIHGTARLPVGLDVLEDEIFEKIEGRGDVTGAGTGDSGWNLDLGFDSMNALNFIARTAMNVLRSHGVVDSVVFNINGRRYSITDMKSKLGL